METVWFVSVALMLTVYVVLDGFDLGAGAASLLAARTPDERRTILKAIGPVWDGNEVWLLAAGGTLFFAYPALYASSFSGFYLPLMMVLWLFMLRATAIELRSHNDNPLWWSFFDFTFVVSSILLMIFFGAAIGNVVRGAPIDANGYFFEPLWTTFRVTGKPGILDWYTVLIAVVALTALTVHGSAYVALKTEAGLSERARRVVRSGGLLLIGLTLVSLAATLWIRPELLANYRSHPVGLLIPALVVAGLGGIQVFARAGNERMTFASSALYLAGMLGGAAYAVYPTLLHSTNDPAGSLTIYNSAAPDYALKSALWWWPVGMVLVLGYFTYLYRSFRGKVDLSTEH